MTYEEQKQVEITNYVNLMRIKAHQKEENPELEYQIRVARVRLQNFAIDYSQLEY